MKTLVKQTLLCTLLMICVTLPLSAHSKKQDRSMPKTIRFMDFNIADGMWKDQYNNYDKFVKWMKSQKVDVFAVCEAATHWNEFKRNIPKRDDVRYLPAHWGELASRWGHKYTALGAYQDNYPVAVTSRFPIEVVQRIGGKQLSHGALHVKVKGVNYVVVHLWPHHYRKGDKTKTKGNGGHEYRLAEMRYILEQTILNPKYANEEHWVMTGDFNSYSPKDRDLYAKKFGKGSYRLNYDVHNEVLKAYPHDVLHDKNPNNFQASTHGGNRIDYIYCTEKLYSAIGEAYSINDDFVRSSSDHIPLVMTIKRVSKK